MILNNRLTQKIDHKITCSFCNSSEMGLVIDFGRVALAGGFLTKEQIPLEKKYPLRVYYCHDCCAVQVVDKIAADVLFDNYFYFSSSIKTLKDHFKEYATEVSSRFLTPSTATVLEFGCNDGVLLKPLADLGISRVIGVDPAKNVVTQINDSRINIVNDFFTEEVAENIVDNFGKIDMIVANNVYAHIPDIQGVTRAISNSLKDNGVFIFEVHYLGKVIDDLQYDMIYHEHLYYYSLLSAINHFNRYGMVVFDVKEVSIHGGSIRFYVCKKNSIHAKNISESTRNLEIKEREKGFNQYKTFERFSNKTKLHRTELRSLLDQLKSKRFKVAGYGASGRANTMIQYCGIDKYYLNYMIDDAPAKIGFYTPGSHFEIYPSSILKEKDKAPDFLLIFAWSFLDEIIKRSSEYLDGGGRMIIPLPFISIYPLNN